MTGVSKHRVLAFALRLASVLLLAKVISLGVGLFLVFQDTHYLPNQNSIARHFFKFDDAFFTQTAPVLSEETQKLMNYSTLDTWHLQALYSEGKSGFIVVVIQGETFYIDLGQTHEGYTLVRIQERQALLTREDVEYVLAIEEDSAANDAMQAPAAAPTPSAPSTVDMAELQKGIVRRGAINEYMADNQKIWQNIKIIPKKNGEQIEGFLVRFVQPNSVFDVLGLKANDVIVSANGIKLDSIEAAQTLYKHINEIEHVAITVQRNQSLQELIYEIK
ncbi:MAG: hypothetical protein KU37_04035 [Sulfuricurvum sp. PC08-66]|nr:MAG: hypothetical protein KU37_04035 [Sulfuricurvum sp. PC08-66]